MVKNNYSLIDIINFVRDFIRIDLFIGFGLYSIIFFVLNKTLKNNLFLKRFDDNTIKLVIRLGFVWISLWLLGLILYYFSLENQAERIKYLERLTGEYSYGIWAQPIFWFVLTQLYRITFFTKYLVNRLIISFLFVLTFERFIIIIVTIHRDYSPDNWSLFDDFDIDGMFLIQGLLAKILVVLTIFSLHHILIERMKLLKLKT